MNATQTIWGRPEFHHKIHPMHVYGSSTVETDWIIKGTQATAYHGYEGMLFNECNYCTLKRIQGYDRKIDIVSCITGVDLVLIGHVPLVWLDSIPDKCVCNF